MAKQTVGPLILHLEKAVLGIAVLVLLGAIVLYGAMSPNRLPDADVGPGEVDKAAQDAAENLRGRLQTSKPELGGDEGPAMLAEPPMQTIRRAENPLAIADVPARMLATVPWGPQLKTKLDVDEAGPRANLAEVLAPEKPQVQFGRSGLILAPPEPFDSTSGGGGGDDVYLTDVNWVTITAPFDREEQIAKFQQAGYDFKGQVLIALGLDVERRMLKADGTWEEWAPVSPVYRRLRPPRPEVNLIRNNDRVDADPSSRDDVEAFVALIMRGEAQLELLRPLFPEVRYGDPWTFPKDLEYDVTDMDAEYQAEATCRYPECATTQTDIRIDATLPFRDLQKAAEEALSNKNFREAQAYADAAESKAERESDKRRIQELKQRISSELAAAEAAPKKDIPVQAFWVHDAAAGSVLSGRTYQYRARVRLFNRYCATPALLNNPEDAALVELVGPWSEPSDPVNIPRDTLIFARSARARGDAKVDIFKWVGGVWLRRTFDAEVGGKLGGVQRVDTPAGPRQEVDFDTKATVVDIDLQRPFKTRRGGRPDKWAETAAIVYVDEAGQLHERLLDFDKSSAEYKSRSNAVWKGE